MKADTPIGSKSKAGRQLNAIESATRISAFLAFFRNFAKMRDVAWGDYFLIFYGSYAYRCATARSDLDVLLVSDSVSVTERDALITEIHELHHAFDMPLDNEIPYEAKAMIDIGFLNDAVSGAGIRGADGWTIPKIVKTTQFLTTPINLQRFLLGMMTHPHVFVCGNRCGYKTCRELAFCTLIPALREIHSLDEDADLAKYLAAFCGAKDMSGDMFLGYSNQEPFVSYLSEHLHYRLGGLQRSTVTAPVKPP